MFPSSSQFTILLVILAAGGVQLTVGELKEAFRLVEPGFVITPVLYTPGGRLSEQGHVHGAKSCGGPSQADVPEIRIDVCVTGSPVPCAMESHRISHMEFVIIPKESVKSIILTPGVNTTTSDGDEESYSFDIPMPKQSLVEGEAYLFSTNLTILPDLMGKRFSGWTKVTAMEDKRLVACAQGEFHGH